jgi:predicted flavoprotein YhiN
MVLNTVLIGQKAGEIIDLDAETGGYNLQIAWSTGWLAGNSASAK